MIIEFNERGVAEITKIFGENPGTEKAVETIRREPCGRFYVSCDGLNASISWAKIGKNKYVKTRYDYIGVFGPVIHPCIWEEDLSRDQKSLESILLSVSEKTYARYRRFRTRALIRCYRSDLRLRTGYRTWKESIDIDGLVAIQDDPRLKILLAEHPVEHPENKIYLITPFGTFRTEYTKIIHAVRELFGLDVDRYRNPEGFRKAAEEQLRIREEIETKMRISFERLKGKRIIDFHPDYGFMTEGYFYPVGERCFAVRLPVRFRSIRELLFGLYGREIPERPDFIIDIELPPWTIRRFGRREAYILLDEFRDIIVYLEKIGEKIGHRYYLNLGPFFGDREYRLKSARTVRAAFREVFGVDLPPDATRDDIEAIITLRAISS